MTTSHFRHDERRKHKRFPVIKDLAEPIELAMVDNNHMSKIPGILTNFSAGGMDLVLMGQVPDKSSVRLSMHLPGFDRFSVEGKLVWSRSKGATSQVGIQFTKIDADHVNQINHMAEAFWECEDRIKTEAPTICFHGCTYWDLCEKPAKLKSPRSSSTRA